MKVVVIMNAAAGSIGAEQRDERVRQVRTAFEAASIEAEVLLCEPAHLTETARSAAARGFDAIVAAGGDGTVSAVAAGLVGGDVPLAVLPLGTLNHFARDIGMPDDLGEAARVIAERHAARIDVGELDGRVFLNNSSLGLYPEMVMHRDVEQKRTGRGKWRAMLLAAFRVVRRFRLLSVRVATPEQTCTTTTPFLFIGNNAYSTTITSLGKRASLDQGRLGLYLLHSRGRLHTFWLVLQALVGRAQEARELEVQLVTEVWVSDRHHRRRRLTVALDGEVARMTTPLHYRILAGALPVLVAPAKQVAAPTELATAEAPATERDPPPRAVASYPTPRAKAGR